MRLEFRAIDAQLTDAGFAVRFRRVEPLNVAAAFYAPEQAARDWERDRAFARVDHAHALANAKRIEWRRKTERVALREVLSDTSSDAAVKHWARRRACEAQVIGGNEPDPASAFCALRTYLSRWHVGEAYVQAPELREVETVPQYGPWIARVTCRVWWTRAARVMLGRGIEAAQVDAGRVHRRAGVYVSDRNAERGRQQQQRNAQMLLDMEAENELGERVSLASMAKGSASNPWIRFCELMVTLKGLEATAETGGWVGLFVTWTLPSAYHARGAASGERNPKYERKRAREGQGRFMELWVRARAQVAKWGARWFGLRVAEPHHDGTPHWHLMVWVRPEDSARVLALLKSLALEEGADEPGAQLHRCKVEPMRPKGPDGKGGAASYLAKYVAKLTTGGQGTTSERGADGVRRDLHGKPSEKAQRARWWASLHGIRQFQFWGIPPRGIWREARRIREPLTVAQIPQAGPAQLALFERVRLSADTSDYAAHVAALGGVAVPRKGLRVQLMKELPEGPTRYGEDRGPVTIGLRLRSGLVSVLTRAHSWVLKRARSATSQGSETAPWTRGNNCNGGGTYAHFPDLLPPVTDAERSKFWDRWSLHAVRSEVTTWQATTAAASSG